MGRFIRTFRLPLIKTKGNPCGCALSRWNPADANTVFTGSYRVWRTRNDGENWHVVSPSLDGSSISAIEVAPANSKRVYVATENGGFFRSLEWRRHLEPESFEFSAAGPHDTRLESHPKMPTW